MQSVKYSVVDWRNIDREAFPEVTWQTESEAEFELECYL